jgi:hypothetical protein
MAETKRDFTETTPRNFEADQRICDAATAGPWFTEWEGVCDRNNDAIIIEATSREDSRFIAEARTGWPAALAEIARLRKYAGFLRSVIRSGESLPDDYCIETFLKAADDAL